nr:unnamed protein product [Digitaria exilis]
MASGADRISNLPEVILHHILSLLPAQDAVRTCVLAQSWRHHWRSAPAVRVAGCTGWAGGVYTFGPFVDGLLSARRGGAPLESCDFELDVDLDLGPYDVPKMQRHVNGWIRRALRRGYVFNRDLEWCPTFSKLKTLVLGYWFVSTDLSALIWFLRHAPLLEKLTLKYLKVDNNPTKMEVNDKALEQPIAASHLQIVEIKCKCVDGIVLEILEVLNDIGVPQEKVRVKVSGRKLSMNSHDSLCNCRVP